jgi:serine/threonine-protein kinase
MTCPSCAADTGSSAVCASCGALLEASGLAAGTVVAGRYEVRERLGVGGMGVVYKARDRLLDEVVALKVLRREATDSDEMARRFRSEIRLARAVSHRNVCRIHEYGEEGALRYVSMAFVDGVDLRRRLAERGRFSGEESASLAVQIAEALEAIHQEGIVHRDLKPGNVMIDARGVARVMDFGIAKHWDNAAAAMTGTGQLVGTPTYMSPEQIRGEKLDGRSDLYSLGVVVFELATGRAPFRGDTPLATLFKHVNEPPPLRGPEATLLPPALLPVLESALAKDRDHRFATAREMAEALAQAGRSCAATAAPATHTIASPPVITASAAATTAVPSVTAVPAETAAPAVTSHGQPALNASPSTASAASPARRWAWPVALFLLVGIAAAALAVRQQRRPQAAPAAGEMPSVAPAALVPSPPQSLSAVEPSSTLAPPPRAAVTVPVTPAGARPAPPARDRDQDISSAAAMAGLLAEADAALADHANDLAGTLYDQVLAIDPRNEKARAGRARVAEALARGPAGAPARGRFVAGQTRADSAAAPAGPAGFETTAGLAVRRLEQAQSPGGKIYFEVSPPDVAPGDRYTVRAYLVNESGSAIDIGDLVVTIAVNGRPTGGRVDPRLRQLAAGQRGLILEAQEVWRTETRTWAMTVTVRTPHGESYTNQLTWP